jgi:hypothetical protein
MLHTRSLPTTTEGAAGFYNGSPNSYDACNFINYSCDYCTSRIKTELDSAASRVKTHTIDGAAQAFRKLISPLRVRPGGHLDGQSAQYKQGLRD